MFKRNVQIIRMKLNIYIMNYTILLYSNKACHQYIYYNCSEYW